jgi:hypothetical protein
VNFDAFHPSLRCSSSVHVASGAAIFTLLLCRRFAFLDRTATCRQLFKPWVTLLPTYRKIEAVFRIFIAFLRFLFGLVYEVSPFLWHWKPLVHEFIKGLYNRTSSLLTHQFYFVFLTGCVCLSTEIEVVCNSMNVLSTVFNVLSILVLIHNLHTICEPIY